MFKVLLKSETGERLREIDLAGVQDAAPSAVVFDDQVYVKDDLGAWFGQQRPPGFSYRLVSSVVVSSVAGQLTLLPTVEPDRGWPKDFREQFWSTYPRKVGKGIAIRKLETIKKSGVVAFDHLLSAVQRYAAQTITTDIAYIAHPATWLSQGRWDDDPRGNSPPTGGRDTRSGFASLTAKLHGQ